MSMVCYITLTSVSNASTGVLRHQQPSYLLVGPEGDFTPEEIQQLMEAGALPVGLGSNRLRTETAAVALLATARMWSELNC